MKFSHLLSSIFIFAFSGCGNNHSPENDATTIEGIRDHTSLMCEWGSKSAQVGMGIFTDAWSRTKDLLDSGTNAVMCQGAAYSLHMRYKSLGYETYLVGFQADKLSHAICLVGLDDRLIVMDPTFNVNF